MTTDAAKFERDRLAMFARNGFEAESRRIRDRKGRSTYMLARGVDPCPTVLVHGGLSECGEWSLLAGRISGAVAVVDRPGCGLSYPIDYRGVDYRRHAAEWMSDLVDGLEADRVDLVGSSMGGFFAIAFAIENPERVRQLVLVGAPAGLDRHIPLFLRLWANPVAGRLISRFPITDPEVLRRRVFARLLVADAGAVPLEFLELAVAAASLPGAARASQTMLHAVCTMRGWRPDLSLRGEIASLEVPTVFAWGDSDAFAPPASGEELAPRMPDARVEVIPDTGHLPQLERPEAVAAAITAKQ